MMCHSLVLLIFIAAAFTAGCRKSPKEPSNTLSGQQRMLTDAMSPSAAPDACSSGVLLSLRLHRILEEYAREDSALSLGDDSAFNRSLDSMALVLSSRLFMETDVKRIIDELNRTVFDVWGVAFTDDRNDPRSLFAHSVVEHRRGSCVGMSLIYLLLGEKLGLPLYGVLAPSHMFVRYDDGVARFNIETLRSGECMSDDWYRHRYGITDTSLYPLRNLDCAGVSAVVHYNIGNIMFHEKRFDNAVRHHQAALEALPGFPEAQGNLALALDARGEGAAALSRLIALRDVYPSLDKIDENIAAIQLRCGRYGDALTSYSGLCSRSPGEPGFYYGRAAALFYSDRKEEAAASLDTALRLRPDYPEARELLSRIDKAQNAH